MTPDEHRAAAERLLNLADDHVIGHHWTPAGALAQAATAHAVLAQTPQPVTVVADPDAGLVDMLAAARVAGAGDGQAILAGRDMAGERCVCGHRQELHTTAITMECVATWRDEDNRLTVCTCAFYEPVGSEPGEREPEAGEYGYVSSEEASDA